MADIISLNGRIQQKQAVEQTRVARRKALALRQALHCRKCSNICEKCGLEIDENELLKSRVDHDHEVAIPYRFCESCLEEYLDFIHRLQGKGKVQYYWRNVEWIETWRRWIDYQASMDRYVKTRDFIRLVDEMQQGVSSE